MLVKKGHQVKTFSLKRHDDYFEKEGIPIEIHKRRGYLSTYLQIYRLIKKDRPEIILSNFSYVNPSLLFGKLLGVRQNMVWFHSLNEQMEATWLNIFIKTRFLKLADVVIANSFLTAQELHRIYKVPQDKIKTLPFWSTISQDGPTLEDLPGVHQVSELKIGCPGRMAAHKNQKIVIEAFAQLYEERNLNAHLYFAGRGDTLNNLIKQAEDLTISQSVSFLGHLSASEMLKFYSQMDVIVLPSLHEAFGLVFIEAISLGVPVIVSNKFGALSFIDKQKLNLDDFTFSPDSAEQLKNKLLPYLNDGGFSSAFFKKMYDENFDRLRIFEEFSKCLSV